jgi:hypothetical protein
MSGCDYNKNIPNLGIGKSYILLKKYNKIEDCPHDKTCLQVDICRALFKHDDTLDITENLELDKEAFIRDARSFLGSFNLLNHMKRLSEAF